jgi:hypothetical protein
LLVFLKFIAAIAMLAGLHVGAMAALGRCLGIKVRRISLGFGPSLFSLGIFQLRLLPIAGSIAFKDAYRGCPRRRATMCSTTSGHPGAPAARRPLRSRWSRCSVALGGAGAVLAGGARCSVAAEMSAPGLQPSAPAVL